ncbi:type II toxin-antitoxin system RelB/DinJ family antitoxin [Helicobacter sp.]|uniref:type II toxin-antitoxin system RelB/DinJ family antitoxin n=1 Tax=Helicobacter sp. TaxID=218 RepID=UPI0025BD2B2A|nr:type II toxin-antitoxin system RelB/DinJ family antitoxin [Helicobacter sp.]MBR2493915.1 type II toxin-antitoxin system RelB/DinJ family antitoxin [Helicobacter sp.]
MTTLVQVRVEKELKDKADKLFNELGLDTTTAIRIFLKSAINNQGLPFKVQTKTQKEAQAFYSPENIAMLKKSYAEIKQGKAVEKELINEKDVL